MRSTLAAGTWASCLWFATSIAAQDLAPSDSVARFDFHASGSVRFDYFRSGRQLDAATDLYGTTVQAKLEPQWSDALDGKFEFRATRPDLADRGERSQATLLEGYLTYRTERTRVRLGKQIVAWGRTDGINPTDNLTPRNYVVLLPFEGDQRFGTTALTLDRSFGADKTLALFASPYFEPSRIPLPEAQAHFVDQTPAHRLSNSEFGARLDKAGGRLDWSLSYFHGYGLFPDLQPLGYSSAGAPRLGLRYGKVTVLGADFATAMGRYGLRGEIAYHRTADDDGEDPFTKNSFLYYVFGGDRTFGENFNINLQLFGRRIHAFADPDDIADLTVRTVAALNALVNYQQERDSYGMTARIGKRWRNDTLRAELLALVNFTHRSSYVRPLLTYDVTDRVNVAIGAELFHGSSNTYFGVLKENRGLFAEVNYAL